MIASNSQDDEPFVDINTTPLIDVLLVLLVMLIITIPVQLHAINLQTPTITQAPQSIKPVVIKLEATRDNRILWDGQALADKSDLQQRLMNVAKAAPDMASQPEVHISADSHAKYDAVITIMAACQRAGLKKLGVLGS